MPFLSSNETDGILPSKSYESMSTTVETDDNAGQELETSLLSAVTVFQKESIERATSLILDEKVWTANQQLSAICTVVCFWRPCWVNLRPRRLFLICKTTG